MISNSLASSKIQWPGIPDEHAMPFRNVEYLDDLFTWAEAEGLTGDADDHDDEPACDDQADEKVTA